MDTLTAVLKVTHITTAILMAWPFYALVVVNQRVRLGPPLGDRADTYMENIIKNRTIPCFVFQLTALLTGVWLVLEMGAGWSPLVENPRLALKLVGLVGIGGLLGYVHTNLQPRIDGLFARGADGGFASELAAEISTLRGQRKRMASVCLFVVLTEAMLGVQVWMPFSWWLNLVFIAAIAALTVRAYRTETPYGWA